MKAKNFILFLVLLFVLPVLGISQTCDCKQYGYLPDFGTNVVHKFLIDDATGAFTEIGSPWASIPGPHGIAVNPYTGDLLISDFTNYEYDVYSCNGTKKLDNVIIDDGAYNAVSIGNVMYMVPRNSGCMLHAYDLCDYSLIGVVQLNSTTCGTTTADRNWGIDVGPDGMIYITDNYVGGRNTGNGDIYKVDPLITNFTDPATVTVNPFISGLNVLFGITVDNNGNIYVVEHASNSNSATTIKQFDSMGNLLCSLSDNTNEGSGLDQGFYNAWGIEWDPIHDVLYLSSWDDDCIAIVSTGCPMTYEGAAVQNVPSSDAKGLRLVTECCYSPATDVITYNACTDPVGTPIDLSALIDCAMCSGTYTRTAGTGGTLDNCTYVFTPTATTTNTTYQFTTGSASACGSVTITINITTECAPVCALNITCSSTPQTSCTPVDGTASVSVTGGVGNITYLWSDGSTTSAITGKTAGTYTVTVTDDDPTAGCTKTCTATITSTVTNPTVTCTPTNNTNCITPNGSVSATATNVSYAWSNGATTAAITGLSAGTYTVIVTDLTSECTNSCQSVVSTITVVPTCTVTTNASPTCANLTGGSLTVNISPAGSYTYLWSNGATTATVSGLTGGSYTVTVTGAGNCTSTCQATLSTPTGCCNINAISIQSLTCLDNGTPTLTTDNRIRVGILATNSNAILTTYNVSVNGGTTISPSTGTYGTGTFFLLGPGTAGGGATFTITLTDSTNPGCTATVQVTDPGNCNNAVPCPDPQCGTATIQVNGN